MLFNFLSVLPDSLYLKYTEPYNLVNMQMKKTYKKFIIVCR